MARKDRSVGPRDRNQPTKSTRRRGTPGQGRLRQRQITAADVGRCADAGNIPPGRRRTFERWLRSTLEICWLADRHYRTPPTLAAKKAELAQISTTVQRLKIAFQKAHFREHLIGAGIQRLVFKKSPMTADRHQKMAQATVNRMRRIVRYTHWLDDLLQRDLRFLNLRPESGDERRALRQASKPAIKYVTHSIIMFWKGQLGRRSPTASAMADLTAAVFITAGEREVSRETAVVRLKTALRSRR